MVLSRNYLKSFIGDKAFHKTALAIMIPIVIQQLINTLFNVVDNLMVGQISGVAMSGVSVANRPSLIYYGFFYGITGAGGLMLSQFFGAGETRKCQSIFALEMILGFVCALLFCAVMFFFAEPVMLLFVSDPETIDLGVRYLRLVAFSYLPAAISTTCMLAMRALGHAKIPMLLSILAMALNGFFNYCFIFGHFGAPEMGVEGAALGTLMARLVEMALYLFILFKKSAFFSLNMKAVTDIGKNVFNSFLKKALPLTLNEMLWTGGLSVYFWAYARLDEAALPALTISDLVVQIGFVVSMGMGGAVSVIIGTRLGAGEFEKAKKSTKNLLSLSCALAVMSTIIGLIMSMLLPGIFNVDASMQHLAKQLSWLGAAFYLPGAVYAFCFFVLRAGGDTKNAALLDSGYMWVLPVPVAILLGLFGKGRISVILGMAIVQTLMNLKVIIALIVVRKGKWIRNITKDA